MASILVYTSPARGHLYPALGVAVELRSRGHEVHVRTLSTEVERVRELGMGAEPIASGIEARAMDDWRGSNPMQSLERAMKTFGDRSVLEVDDLREAIGACTPDTLLVDTNCWGAQAVAEASGLPWAVFQPYLTALPAPGVPPFGPGLRRSTGPAGRVRDALLGKAIFARMGRTAMPAINEARSREGLESLRGIPDLYARAPRVLYFTAPEFDYPRGAWPAGYVFVGPGLWAPPSETPEWLDAIDRPITHVTCSTERQNDSTIVEAATAALPAAGLSVVATSAAFEPDRLRPTGTAHCRVERFVAHDAILDRASVVVCHGGMGITQRALTHGVPVVVVPFGRDQPEVARRVEYAGLGVRLTPGDLTPQSLAAAVRTARTMKANAERMAQAFARTGGAGAAADALEELHTGVGV